MSVFIAPDGRLYRTDPKTRQTVRVIRTPQPTSPATQPTSPAPETTPSPSPEPTSPAPTTRTTRTTRSSRSPRRTYTPGSIREETQPTTPTPTPEPTSPATQPTTPARTGTITLDPTPTVTPDGLRFTGTSDPGLSRVPGETQERFQERQTLKTEFDARQEATRLAQETPGTRVTVDLGFTPTTGLTPMSRQPSISPSSIDTRTPMRTESRFIIKDTGRTPTTSNILAGSALFASQTPRDTDFKVGQTLSVPGTRRTVQVGGLEPSTKGRGLTTSAAVGIDKLASRVQGRDPSARVAISSAEQTRRILGFTRAERIAERGRDFVSVRPPGVSDDVVFPRGGEFSSRVALGAVSEAARDPLRTTALVGGGLIGGAVVGAGAGAVVGALPVGTSRVVSRVGGFALTGAAVVGTGALAFDIARSPDRERRASQLLSEGVALTPGVGVFRRTFAAARFEGVRLRGLQTEPFTKPPVSVSGAPQTTLTGGFIDDAALRRTGLVFDTTPLGLPSGATARSPGLVSKGTITRTDIPGFVTTTRTESGSVVGLQRYGTRELGFERTRISGVDVVTGTRRELSPSEFARLVRDVPDRFRISSIEDPFSVPSPRFAPSAPSVQTKLAFDVTTGELSSAVPSARSTGVGRVRTFDSLFSSKRGQARVPSLDFEKVIDSTVSVGRRVVSVAREPVSSIATRPTRSVFVPPSPFTSSARPVAREETIIRSDVLVRSARDREQDVASRTRSAIGTALVQRPITSTVTDTALRTDVSTSLSTRSRSITRTDTRSATDLITSPKPITTQITSPISTPRPTRVLRTDFLRPSPRPGLPSPFPSVDIPRRTSGVTPRTPTRDLKGFFPALKTATPGARFFRDPIRTIRLGGEIKKEDRKRKSFFNDYF